MPPNRPNRETVLERENQAWRLRCRGWTLARIAHRMSLSVEGVRKILLRVEERESKELTRHYLHTKTRQNGQIEHVIEESFGAWHKSKKPRSRATRRTAEGVEMTQTEALSQYGDPRYLSMVLAAQAAQRELLGFNIGAAENPGATVADLARDLERRGAAYERRRREQAEGGHHGSEAGAQAEDVAEPAMGTNPG
jgi:hypothetical protein